MFPVFRAHLGFAVKEASKTNIWAEGRGRLFLPSIDTSFRYAVPSALLGIEVAHPLDLPMQMDI
ncbi:hypothetical protein ACFQPB_22030 [Hydrogenophaga atypica]|uniref:Uncharacterized protein n=1 Tax=Hydrogenophaga atypica TaxID=249409 RepID=A0ABW2QQW9_9BURK